MWLPWCRLKNCKIVGSSVICSLPLFALLTGYHWRLLLWCLSCSHQFDCSLAIQYSTSTSTSSSILCWHQPGSSSNQRRSFHYFWRRTASLCIAAASQMEHCSFFLRNGTDGADGATGVVLVRKNQNKPVIFCLVGHCKMHWNAINASLTIQCVGKIDCFTFTFFLKSPSNVQVLYDILSIFLQFAPGRHWRAAK